MAADINSVAYMKEYLKFALEFEKNKYIWTNAMDEVNAKMRQIHSEKKQMESIISTVSNSLYSNPDLIAQQKNYNKTEILKYKKKNRNILIFIVVFMLILFVVGAFIGMLSGESGIGFSRSVSALIFGFATMFSGSLFTGVVPVAVCLYASNKRNVKKLEEKERRDFSDDSRRRQQILAATHANSASQNLTIIQHEESVIEKRQNEIFSALNEAKKNLANIYSLNVLPHKYRTFNAVATLYEYLETRRCDTIAGHGGIFDTYEVEKIQLEQLQQMIQMNQRLANIEDYQRYICQEISKANRTLSNISSSLNRIEKTTEEIANNTAISAEANKQTAMATSWLAWRAWAHGY